jgi:hypothetical protein
MFNYSLTNQISKLKGLESLSRKDLKDFQNFRKTLSQNAPMKRLVGKFASAVDFRILFDTAKQLLHFDEDPSAGLDTKAIYFVLNQGFIEHILQAKFTPKHNADLAEVTLQIKENLASYFSDYQPDEIIAKEIQNFRFAQELKQAGVIGSNFTSSLHSSTHTELLDYFTGRHDIGEYQSKGLHINNSSDIVNLIQHDLHHWICYHEHLYLHHSSPQEPNTYLMEQDHLPANSSSSLNAQPDVVFSNSPPGQPNQADVDSQRCMQEDSERNPSQPLKHNHQDMEIELSPSPTIFSPLLTDCPQVPSEHHVEYQQNPLPILVPDIALASDSQDPHPLPKTKRTKQPSTEVIPIPPHTPPVTASVREYDAAFPPIPPVRTSPPVDLRGDTSYAGTIDYDQPLIPEAPLAGPQAAPPLAFLVAPPPTYATTVTAGVETPEESTKEIIHNNRTIITVNTAIMDITGYFKFKNKLLNITNGIPSNDHELQLLIANESQWLLDHQVERGRIVNQLILMGPNCPFKIKSPPNKKGVTKGTISDSIAPSLHAYQQIVFSNIPPNTLADEQKLKIELTTIAQELGRLHQIYISPENILEATSSRGKARTLIDNSFVLVINTPPFHLKVTHFNITSTNTTTIPKPNNKHVKYHQSYGITFTNDLDIQNTNLLLAIRGPTMMDYSFLGRHIKHVLLPILTHHDFEILAHPAHFHWNQSHHYSAVTMPCFIAVLKQETSYHDIQELHRTLAIHNHTRSLLTMGDRTLEMSVDFTLLQNTPLHPDVCLTQKALMITGCQGLTVDVITAAIPENKRQYIDGVELMNDGKAFVLLKSSSPINFKQFNTDLLSPYQCPNSLSMVTPYHFGFTDHPPKQPNPFIITVTTQVANKSSHALTLQPKNHSNHSKNPYDFEVVSRKKHSSK